LTRSNAIAPLHMVSVHVIFVERGSTVHRVQRHISLV
jgi:hypothetical protein